MIFRFRARFQPAGASVDKAFSLEQSVSKSRAIEKVFQLPDDTKPKWYLENDIDSKVPDDYLLPSKSPSSTTMWRKN